VAEIVVDGKVVKVEATDDKLIDQVAGAGGKPKKEG
jgi:hypothetical protein